MSNTPLNDRVAHHADAVRIGDHHWAFEKTGFFDPGCAGPFAVAIERPRSLNSGIHHGIYATRENGRDASSDRALANITFAFAGDERGVTHSDAGNVGDGVQRAGRAIKRDAEIAGARLLGRFLLRGKDKRKRKAETECERKLAKTMAHFFLHGMNERTALN